jgi:hypothetical protein
MAAPAEDEREARARKAMKCARDLADVPPEAFRLPDDGTKWKAVCINRSRVLHRMSLAVNGDGSSMRLSVPTLAKGLSLSRSTVFVILKDLKQLGFLLDTERFDPICKTRVRQIDVRKVLSISPPVQNSFSPVQNGSAPVQNSDGPNRETTENLTENRKQGCTGVQALIPNSSGKSKSKPTRSSREPIPEESWDAILRHIQGPDFAEVEWRPIRRDRAALRSLWALAPEVEAICDALDAAVSHGATCAETLFSIATQLLERDYFGTRSQKAGTA